MDVEEYKAICTYLICGDYPNNVLNSKVPSHSKKFFRRKCEPFRIDRSEGEKLYKVRLVLIL